MITYEGTPLTPISYLLLFVQFGELILLLFTRLHMLGYIVADSFVSPKPRMPLAPRLSPTASVARRGDVLANCNDPDGARRGGAASRAREEFAAEGGRAPDMHRGLVARACGKT